MIILSCRYVIGMSLEENGDYYVSGIFPAYYYVMFEHDGKISDCLRVAATESL